MAAQKREAGKNYIGLLNDDLEPPRGATCSADSDRSIRNYVLGLMAHWLDRRGNAR